MTHNKSTKQKSRKNLHTDRKAIKKSLVSGSLIATLIAVTPYIFYSYESVPDTKVWDTFLFTFTSNFYEDANIAMWIFMMKAIPLLLLFIWFFTCKHWWYHVLLIPIAMFSFQLIAAIVDETKIMDEFQLMYLLPIMAIIIPSIYLIRAKMFDKMNNASIQDLEDEFKITRKSIKDFF